MLRCRVYSLYVERIVRIEYFAKKMEFAATVKRYFLAAVKDVEVKASFEIFEQKKSS